MLATLRHRDFALLWVAGLVSVAGDYALITALPLHAYALTSSAVAAGGVFAASIVPRVLLGSIAGVFVDRWDRKRTMVAADLLRAVLLLPLLAVVAPDWLWLLFLVRAATGTLGLFFGPAESALLPRLVGEERLVTANALNALNDNLGRLAGPAAGGLLYAAGGLATVVLIDAASFAVSAALIVAIRTNARPEPAAVAPDVTAGSAVFREWLAGLRLVRRAVALRAIFAAIGLGFVAEGTFEAGFAPLVIDVMRGGAGAAGLLLSAQAIGGFLAGALVAQVAARVPPRTLFGAGLIGLGLADFGFANATRLAPAGAPAVTVAAAFMVFAGFPVVAAFAAENGMVQTLTADAYRGRVFGALGTTQALATLVGLALGGLTIDIIGVVPVMSLGALMWATGGAFALLRLSRDAGADASRGPVGDAP